MANELQSATTSGLTIYCVLIDEEGQIWNGANFVAINGANWTDYDIALTESTAGIYLGDMPSVDSGEYMIVVYDQAGGSPAITDTIVETKDIVWDGTEPIDLTDTPYLVWDEVLTGATHNVPTSAGRRLRQIASNLILEGDVVSSTNNTITLDADASVVDGTYDPALIYIVEGTGAGQSRMILEYDGGTKTAVVDRDWKANPDATSNYAIMAHPGREHTNEGLIRAATSYTAQLNALSSTTDDAYNGLVLFIRSGTGQDQARRITDYDGATQTITTRKAWDVTPDATSGYVLLPTAELDVIRLYQGIWEYATRELTGIGSSGIASQTSVDSLRSSMRQYNNVILQNTSTTDIYMRRSADFEWEIYGLGDLSGRSALYFTVKLMKEKDSATDAESVIQIEESGGLLYINGGEAETPGNGTLTVTDEAAGTIVITLDAEETDKLAPNLAYRYDVKKDNTIMTIGKHYISTAITRTIT